MDYIKLVTQDKLITQEAMDNLIANAVNTAKQALEANRAVLDAPKVYEEEFMGTADRVVLSAMAYAEICDFAAKRARYLVEQAYGK